MGVIKIDNKTKGMINELNCINAFIKLGYAVSIPYGDYCRYDFIVDINNKLYKVQCKSSSNKRVDKNIISFKCYSNLYTTKNSWQKKYTKEEIDYFATYYDGKCYLIPIEDSSDRSTFNINITSDKYLINNMLP